MPIAEKFSRRYKSSPHYGCFYENTHQLLDNVLVIYCPQERSMDSFLSIHQSPDSSGGASKWHAAGSLWPLNVATG